MLWKAFYRLKPKMGGDPVPDYVYASHVAVGEVDIEVPDTLIETKGKKAQTR
jgi:hypothetical protein